MAGRDGDARQVQRAAAAEREEIAGDDDVDGVGGGVGGRRRRNVYLCGDSRDEEESVTLGCL